MEYIRLKDVDLKSNIGNRIFVYFMAMDVTNKLQKDHVTKMIDFKMTDRDCVVDCKIFGASEQQIEMIQAGKIFNAAVDVKPYDRATCGYSCIIYNIELNNTENPRSFVDWADDLEGSQQIIQNAINETIETIYGKIAYQIIVKNWGKFSSWAGGKSNHHTRLGDLLTHTAEVIRFSDIIADACNDIYGDGFINKPLLLSAALIHDIGKVEELNVDVFTGHVEYSTEAALSTHIMNALKEIDTACYQLGYGLPEMENTDESSEESIKSEEQYKSEHESILLLKHCVAAHHGKLEWGSPIVSAVPEAYILFKADEMSAELYKYNKSFKDLEPGKSASSWASGELKVTYKETNK